MEQSNEYRNFFDYGFVCAVEVMYHHKDDDEDEDDYKPSDIYQCKERVESSVMLLEVYNNLKHATNNENITIIIKVLEDNPTLPIFGMFAMNYPITFSKFEFWLKQCKIV